MDNNYIKTKNDGNENNMEKNGEIKKKKEKKEKKEKKCKMKKHIVDSDIQIKAIYKSLKQNWIFYIVLISCLYILSQYQNSLFWCLISVVFISFYGYAVHFYSHYVKLKLTEFYKSYDNIFTRNKIFDFVMRQFIDFGEFHAKTHHDSSINKQIKNVLFEFGNNAITQGLSLIILKKLLDKIDNRVIVLWAFFYATVHNINYYFVKPITHQEHHWDDTTNYGIDIWDIIVGSKYNWNNIETHNHAAINLVLLTGLIVYVCKKYKL